MSNVILKTLVDCFHLNYKLYVCILAFLVQQSSVALADSTQTEPVPDVPVSLYLNDLEQRASVKKLLFKSDEGKQLFARVKWLPKKVSDKKIYDGQGHDLANADLIFETPEQLSNLIDDKTIVPAVTNLSSKELKWLGRAAWVPSVCVNTLAISYENLDKPDSYSEALDAEFWGSATGGVLEYVGQTGFSTLESGSSDFSECELVAAGKKLVAISYSYDAARQKARGAPISILRDKSEGSTEVLVPIALVRSGASLGSKVNAEKIVEIIKETPSYWTGLLHTNLLEKNKPR